MTDFCVAILDESPKEQESLVREGQDPNDDEDERQRGRKKEESHWWTRFQVQARLSPITVFYSGY